jgi:hypothetical protein
MADRSLKPYPSHFYRPSISNHYGLITPLSFHRWIELNSVIDHPVVPNPAATLHRIDLDGGHPNEYPFFPFPDIRQSSPHGNSEIIVNHQKPGEVPSWLVPWLTKYDLMNYWPWSACKRIVICEAETGKEVWQKRFPVDGYLQADMSRDQSKLFVLYWKKDQLELYAYSLDFSCRSYWQQSCAALAVFAFFLFFRWPKRKKSGCVPVQPVA